MRRPPRSVRLTPVAWSIALHGALLLVAVPLYHAAEPAPVVVATVEVATTPDLEDPPPPPPPEFDDPERAELDTSAPPEVFDTPPPDDDWAAELDEEIDERVRDVISCPDPRAKSVRFRPARRPAADPPSEGTAKPAPSIPVGPPPGERTTTRPLPPRPATIVSHVAPTYPRTARRRGIEGAVTLRVVIEPDGSVTSIDVVTSSGSALLDRAAVAAVEEWEFRPAEVRGAPVRSTLDLPPIRFRLTD